MQDTILQQGFDLMAYGMGSVFLFLTLLVIAVNIMSWVIRNFLPEPEAFPVDNAAPRSIAPSPSSANVDPKVLKVIQEAVSQHRTKRSG